MPGLCTFNWGLERIASGPILLSKTGMSFKCNPASAANRICIRNFLTLTAVFVGSFPVANGAECSKDRVITQYISDNPLVREFEKEFADGQNALENWYVCNPPPPASEMPSMHAVRNKSECIYGVGPTLRIMADKTNRNIKMEVSFPQSPAKIEFDAKVCLSSSGTNDGPPKATLMVIGQVGSFDILIEGRGSDVKSGFMVREFKPSAGTAAIGK